jgi:hypothetical protein
MERIGDHHRGNRTILKRDLLSDPVADALDPDLVGQDGTQGLLRLDRHHVKAERHQRARQLAGSCGEIDDVISRLNAELGRGRADQCRRVLRSTPLIRVRD